MKRPTKMPLSLLGYLSKFKVVVVGGIVAETVGCLGCYVYFRQLHTSADRRRELYAKNSRLLDLYYYAGSKLRFGDWRERDLKVWAANHEDDK